MREFFDAGVAPARGQILARSRAVARWAKAVWLICLLASLLPSVYAQTLSGTLTGTNTVNDAITLVGNITNNGVLIINKTTTSFSLTNLISGTGSFRAIVAASSSSSGGLTLTAANRYGGVTQVDSSSSGSRANFILNNPTGAALYNGTNGKIIIGNSVYVQTATANQLGTNVSLCWNVTNNANTGYFLLMGHNQTVGNLDPGADAARAVIENTESETGIGNSTLTIWQTSDVVFSGFIRNRSSGTSGTLGIVKNGSGKLTLTGANIIYTGTSVVNDGEMVLSNATAYVSATTVQNSGVVRLIGSVGAEASVVATNGGTVEGSGVIPNLTVNSNGILKILSPSTNSAGAWNTGGTITFSAGSKIDIAGLSLSQQPYVLIRGSSVSGTPTVQGADGFTVANTDNSITLTPAYTYTINNGEVTITGYTGTGGDVEIPATINGDPVTSIADNVFLGLSSITSVTIPNSVTSIGEAVFYRCENLTNAVVGNGLTTLPKNTFSECTNLVSVSLPPDMTALGDYAFNNCRSLAGITLPASLSMIGLSTFNSCVGLTSITFPSGLTSIGDEAFSGCTGFTTVTLPTGVGSLGNYAFNMCSALATVNFEQSSPPTVGAACFAFVNSGAMGYYPASASTAWSGTTITGLTLTASPSPATDFTYTINNGEVTITRYTGSGGVVIIPATINGDPVTSIGGGAFLDRADLSSISIPNSVTSIGGTAFKNCRNLSSMIIPNSVTSLGSFAFSGCDGLTSITLGSSVANIGESTFSGCSSLSSIIIPNSVKSIGKRAFFNCRGLTAITIPSSVITVGEEAFSGCDGLTSVTIGSGVTTIGSSAFINCIGLTSVTIPNNVTSMGISAFTGCRGLTSLTIGSGVTSIAGSTFSGCTSLTSVTIPNTVTSLGIFAFAGCTSLTTITIGSGVTSIAEKAFSGCTSLTTITIPNNVTSMGNLVFFQCSGLTRADIGSGLTSIAPGTFSSCTSLTSVTIPNTVTTIGTQAFRDCTSLTSITIPSSVAIINSDAFKGCTNLAIVNFERTSPPTIGSNVFTNIKPSAIGYFPFTSSVAWSGATIPSLTLMAGDNPDPALISSGFSHTLYLGAGASTVTAWGLNTDGRLGVGNTNSPVNWARAVQGIPTNVTIFSLAAGGTHSLIVAGGQVYAAGSDRYGQLGQGGTNRVNRSSFTNVFGSPSNPVVAVSAGGNHSLIVTASGKVYACGDNFYGQLAQPATTSSSGTFIEVLFPALTNRIVSVAAGADHNLAVDENGGVWVWGRNNYGQLGKGTRTAAERAPSNLAGVTARSAAAGFSHSLILETSGTVRGFGRNNCGQTGQSATSNMVLVPTLISGLSGIRLISAGTDSSFAIDGAGQLRSWGYNAYGELLLGYASPSSSPAVYDPTPSPIATNVFNVSGGGYSSLAVGAQGVIFGGRNDVGQSGNGPDPEQVVGDYNYLGGDLGLGNLTMDLAGTTETLYDQIFVGSGTATLNGILNLMFVGSYTGPVYGSTQTFDLIWAQNGIVLGTGYQLAFNQSGYLAESERVAKDGGEVLRATIRAVVTASDLAKAVDLARPSLDGVESVSYGGSTGVGIRTLSVSSGVEMIYSYERPTGGVTSGAQYFVNGFTYRVEYTASLQLGLVNWNPAVVTGTTITPLGGGYERATLRISSSGGAGFLKLEVE